MYTPTYNNLMYKTIKHHSGNFSWFSNATQDTEDLTSLKGI